VNTNDPIPHRQRPVRDGLTVSVGSAAMRMTQVDELRITIGDALELAQRVEKVNEGREVSLVIVKLEEAYMWAERIEEGLRTVVITIETRDL
jgi:hypothetical protein